MHDLRKMYGWHKMHTKNKWGLCMHDLRTMYDLHKTHTTNKWALCIHVRLSKHYHPTQIWASHQGRCCDEANKGCGVVSLCRSFPKRIKLVRKQEGDRLRH